MQKDLSEKTLESYNDVFADIVNGLLFNGRPVVKEDELVDYESSSQYKTGRKISEQRRDVSKMWMNGRIRLCLYGFENQTKKDRFMPARIISYDGAGYRDQLKKRDGSRLAKLSPVVTLVLYFGTTRWRDRNLHSCLEIPPELVDYVSDYRINVFEIAWLRPEDVGLFKSDFRIVADYFVQKRINKEYVPSRDTIRHVDEVLGMMAALTGDRFYEDVQQEFHGGSWKGGRKSMGGIFEEWHRDGYEKGVAYGREQGLAQGLEQGMVQGLEQGMAQGRALGIKSGITETARKMLLMNVCPIEQISKVTGLSVDEIKKLAVEN